LTKLASATREFYSIRYVLLYRIISCRQTSTDAQFSQVNCNGKLIEQ